MFVRTSPGIDKIIGEAIAAKSRAPHQRLLPLIALQLY